MTLRALARYARPPAPVGERCELCAAPVPETHGHVVDLQQRNLLCACRPCAILFEGAAGRYRTVPTRVLVDPDLELTEATWATLAPVRLVFVFFHSGLGRWSALYPSPAGTTEAEVDDAALRALGTPLVEQLQPDVEALLVWGRRGAPRLDCFLAPIDRCYALAARVRRGWQGFDGGDAVRVELETFFTELRREARPA